MKVINIDGKNRISTSEEIYCVMHNETGQLYPGAQKINAQNT